MAEDSDSKGRKLILRVSVKLNTAEPEAKTPKNILTLTRSADGRETDISLPEGDDVIQTGWSPEIIHHQEGEKDTLEIVIRPEVKSEQAKDKQSRVIRTAQLVDDKNDTLYHVTYVNREVRVNGFRISRQNFGSENELAFDYIYRNPNRLIELSEIEESVGHPLSKKLREVVRDLGFVRELREIFFDLNKTDIYFHNPVTAADYSARELRAPGMKIE